MQGKLFDAWFRAGMDACSLGMDASMVIGLRMAKLAAGGASAQSEAQLMIAEKLRAAIELQGELMKAPLTPLGGTQKTLKHYRRKVAANKRRLSR
jgi:hypothetical protein